MWESHRVGLRLNVQRYAIGRRGLLCSELPLVPSKAEPDLHPGVPSFALSLAGSCAHVASSFAHHTIHCFPPLFSLLAPYSLALSVTICTDFSFSLSFFLSLSPPLFILHLRLLIPSWRTWVVGGIRPLWYFCVELLHGVQVVCVHEFCHGWIKQDLFNPFSRMP